MIYTINDPHRCETCGEQHDREQSKGASRLAETEVERDGLKEALLHAQFEIDASDSQAAKWRRKYEELSAVLAETPENVEAILPWTMERRFSRAVLAALRTRAGIP